MPRLSITRRTAAGLACLLLAGAAGAQEFPTKPVTIIVAFAPGGTSDTLSRMLATGMSTELKQPVLVENIAGGGGLVGMQKLMRSTPDGHTLVFNNMSVAILPYLHPGAGFDPLKDLAPVGLVATVPMVLSVSKSSGIQDLPALVSHMTRNPKKTNFGSGGPGSTAHLSEMLFIKLSKAQAEMIQYRGTGPALADLMAGTIDAVVDQTVTMLPLHKDGRIRAIAVSGSKRLPQYPEIPTFAEGGMPDFDLTIWNGVMAPRGTPKAVVDRLGAAMSAAIDAPEFKARLEALAAEAPDARSRGPAALQQLMARDVARVATLAKDDAFAGR